MYGDRPSTAATHAVAAFRATNATTLLELGAGHGRDTFFFARCGFTVHATGFSTTALSQLRHSAEAADLGPHVNTQVHDVRDPLPLPSASVDAVFAHMLLCMALTTRKIKNLTGEVPRVLRPGGAPVYTVRHTGVAHCGQGIAHGDGIFEHGGFAGHFFDRALVDAVATGWHQSEVHSFEKGELPRCLWRVAQTLPR